MCVSICVYVWVCGSVGARMSVRVCACVSALVGVGHCVRREERVWLRSGVVRLTKGSPGQRGRSLHKGCGYPASSHRPSGAQS